MSTLTFKVNLGSSDLDPVDLPIEIRKANLVLVGQTTTAQSVALTPGTYYVTAKLPAGQELVRQVKVAKGRNRVVELTPEPGDESPHESEAARHFFGGIASDLPQLLTDRGTSTASASSAGGGGGTGWLSTVESLSGSSIERLGPVDDLLRQTTRARLRLFEGNVLAGTYHEVLDFEEWGLRPNVEPWNPRLTPGEVVFHCDARNLVSWVQLLQEDVPAVNVALPMSDRKGCDLIVAWQSWPGSRAIAREQSIAGRTATRAVSIGLDVRLGNLAADALLRYLARGRIDDAATMAAHDSPALVSEDLLQGKVEDPIAATVGAYTLLRTGNIERLHDWTGNLKNLFTWLPDGAVIRAEHLAVVGQHELAVADLLTLPARGLPLFSDGLTYALNRLRFYSSLARDGRITVDPSALEDLVRRLQRVAAVTDFRKPILTFTGLNPVSPDEEPVVWGSVQGFGVDVGQWLTPSAS